MKLEVEGNTIENIIIDKTATIGENYHLEDLN